MSFDMDQLSDNVVLRALIEAKLLLRPFPCDVFQDFGELMKDTRLAPAVDASSLEEAPIERCRSIRILLMSLYNTVVPL